MSESQQLVDRSGENHPMFGAAYWSPKSYVW